MLKVVKIGGNVVDNLEKLDAFLRDFASLDGPKILVHGGGKIATSIGRALGIEARMIEGRRVTDAETLKVVTMVYAGLVNKTIVDKLRTAGCRAFGPVRRRRGADPVAAAQSGAGRLRFRRRSAADRFGLDAARMLIDAGYTPVVAPITADAEGEGLLNTNADTVAQTVAVGMSAVYETELVYCFEKRGVLLDVNDDDSVIAEITPDRFAELRTRGIVADGMLPKLENAFRAIDSRRALGRDLLGRPDRVAGLRGNDVAEVSSRVA